jgi:hypothetical protein
MPLAALMATAVRRLAKRRAATSTATPLHPLAAEAVKTGIDAAMSLPSGRDIILLRSLWVFLPTA